MGKDLDFRMTSELGATYAERRVVRERLVAYGQERISSSRRYTAVTLLLRDPSDLLDSSTSAFRRP